MDSSIVQFNIDKIKEAAGEKNIKEQPLNITGGNGISVVGGGNSWLISYNEDVNKNTFQKYTIQICVDGNPMNLDVYVAGQPY
jgi:hypothetical protein